MDIMYQYLAFLSTIIILYNITIFICKPNKNLPPSPPSLPIIGHLHLLKPPFHRTFHSISQHYGPVFSLRLGRQLVVVVATPSAAEECFTSNDIALANRPKSLVGQHLGYNNSILFWEPYGTHWRNLRRVATLTALSQKQIHLGAPGRHDEVKAAIRDLFQRSESGSQVVNLTELFSKMTTNLLMRVILGEPRETIVKTSSLSMMTPCDFIPVLRWVGHKGIEKELRSVGQERDVELQRWIDEVKRRRDRNDGNDKKVLVQDLLELQEAEPDYYTDEVLKGLILVLLLAGSDTTAKTLEWAMSNLLNHPKVLAKAKAEIDTIVNKQRLINDSDISKLQYIRCIIYETLRLFPPAPLLIPHYSSQDCIIGGYHVPKGTMVFVNAWALHQDPNLWDKAVEFKPERFESEKEEFKYMPFGIGRRACPGNNFAMQNVTLILATLIQCFDWSTVESGQIDLAEHGTNTLMLKEKPLYAKYSVHSSMNGVLSQI